MWQGALRKQKKIECQKRVLFAANPSYQSVLQLFKKIKCLEFECVVTVAILMELHKNFHHFSAIWLTSKCSKSKKVEICTTLPYDPKSGYVVVLSTQNNTT